MPQVIAHPVYGEVEFPDNFDNKQIFEAFQNLDKAAKAKGGFTPKPSSGLDIASDIAIEGGVSIGGQLAGAATGPGYFVIAPAAGVYGNYLKQQQEIARGAKKELSYGEMVAAGLINLLPGVSAGKALGAAGINLATKSTAAKVGYTAGLRAAEGAGIGVTAKGVSEYIDTGGFPTFDEYLSAFGFGAALGGIVGKAEAGIALAAPKLSKNASKLWSSMAGKKASEVGATLDNLAATGSQEERNAASEIVQELNQRLGISGRPPVQPARQSARDILGYEYVPSPETVAARESAQAFQQLTPTESERQLIEMGLKQAAPAPSAMESAAAMGVLPVKPAREAAEVLAQAPMTADEQAARFVPSLEAKSAQESAAAMGVLPVRAAREAAEILAQAPLTADEQASRFVASFQPKSAQESAQALQYAVTPPSKSAATSAELLAQAPLTADEKAANFVAALEPKSAKEAAELLGQGQPIKSAKESAEIFGNLAELEAQRAAEIQQTIAKGRLNAPEQVTFSPETSPEQVGLNILDTRPGNAARERARLNKALGTKPEERLPTTEEELRAMGALPGIGGRAGAREMGLAGVPADAVLPLASIAAGEAAQDEESTPAQRAAYAALATGAAVLAGRKIYKKAVSRMEAKSTTIEEALAASKGIKPTVVAKGQGVSLPSDNPQVQRALKELNVPEAPKAKTLEDVDRLFGETTTDTKFLTIGDRAAELFQNSFRPLAVLESKIRGYTPKFNLADRFSLLGGAGAKAEPAILEMEQVRRQLVDDIHPKDINRYFALNRANQRLQNGIITRGFSLDDTQRLLTDLRNGLGQDKMDRLDKFAQYLQDSADADLKLMVSSGRISQKLYDEIKAKNDFYAPFHFNNKIGELDLMSQRARRNQPINTQAELAKEMVGWDRSDIRLGDIFTAFKRNKYNAQILAEKSAAMKEFVDLAMMDKDGVYAKFIKSPKDAPSGMESVSYLDNGETKYLAVDSSVARAISGMSPIELGFINKFLQIGGLGLRTGATFLSAAWLSKNLPLDILRQMTMSKYGLRTPKDLVPWSGYTLDTIAALGSAIQAHLPGRFKNITPLYKQYLDSGAARSTFASVINEDAFTKAVMRGDDSFVAKLIDVSDKYILSTPTKIANAIEDTVKLMGLKRGMRFENVDKLTPEARAKIMQEIAYEIRNYAGSPDFNKFGSLGRQTNLLLMFANARGQGVAADFARLTGRTGTKEARDAWIRIGLIFGAPAAALWAVNHTPENAEDYSKLSERDKVNFFNIPMYDENGPKYNVDKYGRKVRDYLRFPKRDVSAVLSSTIEKSMDFYAEQSPEAVYEWANALADSISPVSIQGNTAAERGMSVLSSLNPAIKVPIEQITNVNLFRKKPLVGRELQELSPQYQYEESTPEVYKNIAQAVPGISPLRLQSAVEGMTGGAFSQFVKKPQQGRNELASNPFLTSFFSSGSIDESAQFRRIDQLRTQQSDRAFIREMEINKALEVALTLPKEQRQQAMRAALPREVVTDPAFPDTLFRLIVDNKLKVTPVERRTRSLQPSERAQYIYETMAGFKTDDQKRAYLNRQLTIPGMISDDVAIYLKRWQNVRQSRESVAR